MVDDKGNETETEHNGGEEELNASGKSPNKTGDNMEEDKEEGEKTNTNSFPRNVSMQADKGPQQEAKFQKETQKLTKGHIFNSPARACGGKKKKKQDIKKFPGKYGEKGILPRFIVENSVAFFCAIQGVNAKYAYLRPTAFNYAQGREVAQDLDDEIDTLVVAYRSGKPSVIGGKTNYKSYMAVYVFSTEDFESFENSEDPHLAMNEFLKEKASRVAAAFNKDLDTAKKVNRLTGVEEDAYQYGKEDKYVVYDPIPITENNYGNEQLHLCWWMSITDAVRILLLGFDEFNDYASIMQHEEKCANIMFRKKCFDETQKLMLQSILENTMDNPFQIDLSP
ncbi:MAG: hypothetical protein SGARI_000948 [Bacillariaceae sp.]